MQMLAHHLIADVAGVVGPGYEAGVRRAGHPFEGSMWRGSRHKILNIIDNSWHGHAIATSTGENVYESRL